MRIMYTPADGSVNVIVVLDVGSQAYSWRPNMSYTLTGSMSVVLTDSCRPWLVYDTPPFASASK